MSTCPASHSFQAPKGYIPLPFAPDVLSIFGHDAFKDDQKKQLWTIKIPDNVSLRCWECCRE